MQFAALTDKGILRNNNEDFCSAEKVGKFTVLVLADGMGGANSGEVASSMAVKTIFECLDENLLRNIRISDIPKTLSQVINKANTAVYDFSQTDSSYQGMGTTIEICIVAKNTAYIAHIGDSRVYRIAAGGELTRLTKDHSLVEYMIDAGTLTREEAANHPQKNVITKALGTAPCVEADILSCHLKDGDIILMCSDGLSNMLSCDELVAAASEDVALSERAENLIKMANDAGGTDNITVILAQI